jgi:sphinganine-1-phosphate aldolase
MNYLGRDGYLGLKKKLMGIRDAYVQEIRAIDGLATIGEPGSLIIAFQADSQASLDMEAVGLEMLERGWFLGPVKRPRGLMMGLSAPHGPVLPQFAKDLRESVESVRNGTNTTHAARQLY